MQIRQKLVLAFLCVAAIPLLGLSAAVYYHARDQMISDSIDSLDASVTRHKISLEAIISQHKERLRLLTTRGPLRVSLEAFLRKKEESSLETVRRVIQDTANAIEDIQAIFIVDRQGQLVSSSSSDIGFSVIQDHQINRGVSDPTANMFFFLAGPSGQRFLLISGPIVIRNKPIGRAYVIYGTESLRRISSDYRGFGETGEILVAERTAEGDARFVLLRRFENDPNAMSVVKKERLDIPITQALRKNESTFFNTVDYRGHKVLSATRYIDSIDWGIVAKRDLDEALRSVRRLGLVCGFSLLCAILFAVILGLMFSSKLARPLRDLTEFAKSMRKKGQSQMSPNLLNLSDEVGALSRAMQQLLDDLNQINQSLEQQVLERTRELEGQRFVAFNIADDANRAKTNAESAERLLRKRAKELEDKNKELDEFSYVTSHDLQEPLRKITTFAGFLEEDAGDSLPKDAKEHLDVIVKAAMRMQGLIQDLLDLSRAGRREVEKVPIDLSECVDQALDSLETAIAEKGAVIVREDDLPETVFGDVALIRQLYQNLIGNAIKFSSGGPPRIELTSREGAEGWILGVKDNGIGIKSEHMQRIFGAFKRLHGKSEYAGTGIGLAICKKVVERHNGKIWVDSELGKGAHFQFSLGKEIPKNETSARRETGQYSSC